MILAATVATKPPPRVSLGQGSWVEIRKISYSTSSEYYHESARRLIARSAWLEKGWNAFGSTFPKLARRCLTGIRSSASARRPRLVVYGLAEIAPNAAGRCQFVAVDPAGRESEPMETPVLDRLASLNRGGQSARASWRSATPFPTRLVSFACMK